MLPWADIKESARRSLVTYTRIPLSVDWGQPTPSLPPIACLPWVGLLVGILSAWPLVIDFLGYELQALFMLLTAVLITGAFHEDGLIDAADGLVGGWTVEKRLEIMKDSRIGSYGSITIWFALSLKFLLLFRILNESNSVCWVIVIWLFIHSAARVLPLYITRKLPYVTSGVSKAANMIQTLSFKQLCFAITPAFLLALFSFGLLGAMVFGGLIFALNSLIGIYLKQKLDGFNGDTLGASEQIAEVILLLMSLFFIISLQGVML
ncbi:adenosylcobinamide-GDP ribazoletransferase [Marinomonas algicola]|uniref:adenosylcobinamide-GDP ribazoletransferase n=1 Tax=Marinomonas algicola TaxID=2773454 RepID=UPI001EFF4BB4|nr:adenosylcobinamide-GDP ribazoletransferase [Marinomonas algicola]